MITTAQYIWNNGKWHSQSDEVRDPNFCLMFGSRTVIEQNGRKAVRQLQEIYPELKIITISTAGNISSTTVSYDDITATCFEFEKTEVVVKSFKINTKNHKELGVTIAKSFDKKNLATALLYSVNGINVGHLIDGINETFNNEVKVSGGVAGDGLLFEKTLVGIGEDIDSESIIIIGLYSKHLQVSHGNEGGWNTFGPQRIVTKSKNNIVYEIDNIPVLDVYKEYLGIKAKELPGSGLLFPFAIIDKETGKFIIRGVQDVDDKSKSITFFSDVKEGQSFRLMRSNKDNLIKGAGISAQKSLQELPSPQVAILVSCVARRLALDQIIEDEIDEISSTLGSETKICGFYSYSEFSPLEGATNCSLHNQAMTITTLSET